MIYLPNVQNNILENGFEWLQSSELSDLQSI